MSFIYKSNLRVRNAFSLLRKFISVFYHVETDISGFILHRWLDHSKLGSTSVLQLRDACFFCHTLRTNMTPSPKNGFEGYFGPATYWKGKLGKTILTRINSC
jgi:hypothetical protein